MLWRSEGGVVTAGAVQDMWRFHQRVAALRVKVGGREVTWEDVCLRVPRPGNVSEGSTVPGPGAALGVTWLYLGPGREAFCTKVEARATRCLEHTLLEVWGMDGARINNLTDHQVLHDVNQPGTRAAATRHLLGGVKHDAAGRVVWAGSALHLWTTRVQVKDHFVLDHSSGQRVDVAGLRWEEALVAEVKALKASRGGQGPLVRAAHSLGKTATDAITEDLKWVGVGGVMVVVYVVATMPHPLLVVVGLVVGVPLTVLASYGLCAALAVPFSFLNMLLPVLVAGLGIDDMYVLAAAWEAEGREGKGGVAERGGRALRRVGVAITLTSLTDVFAFLVGASTRLPGLRWFCVYAAAGITCVFFLHVTLFVAALAVHQRWRGAAAYRCGPPCTGLVQRAMARYGPLLLRPAVGPVVIVAAAGLMAVGGWGAASLRHQFIVTEWFLPPSSDLHHMMLQHHQQFPRQGEHSYVYFANVTLPQDLPGLSALAAALQASPYVQSVAAWFLAFQDFLPPDGQTPSPSQFREALTVFLHSQLGARFTSDMEFSAPLRCRQAAPPVAAFRMHLRHRLLDTMEEQKAALHEVRRLVAAAQVSGFRGAWGDAYSQWETGDMIGEEVLRGLAMVVVMVGVVTLMVVGAGRAAVLVVGCVLATLLQVAAVMHLSGLTVNTVTAITLLLAAGLSVDYAAHIAHAFMAATGTRRARACTAVVEMGPPVLHAGVSTLLAFAALGPSTTYLFTAYFKILTSVAGLSLVQGLMVLPVLLALLGPHNSHTHSGTTPTPDTLTENTPTPSNTTPHPAPE